MIGQHVEENKRMCLSLFLCSCHPLFNEKLNFQLFQFNNQIPYTHSSTFLNMALRLFPVRQDQKHLFRRNDKHLIIRGIRKNGYELDNDLFEPPIFTVFDDCFSEASFSVLFELP